MEINKIYCMDSIDLMKQIPDNYVDLILTDPPYGINENNERNLSRARMAKSIDYGHYEWDKIKIDKKYFDEMLRISKNQIIFGYVACEDCLKDKSLLELKSHKHCRDCKYSRFDESVLEVVCAVNLIKGLRDTVTSLPPLRTCSAFERKEGNKNVRVK